MLSVLLLASIQAFFLVALLTAKRQQQLSDRVLAIWLGCIGAHTLLYFLHGRFGLSDPRLMLLSAGVPFLQGPFLYYYVDTLTAPCARIRPSYALHFLPFIAFEVYGFFLWESAKVGAHPHHINVGLFEISTLSNVVLLLSVPAYSLASLWRLRMYRREIYATFSTVDHINLNWLRYLISAMVLVWLAVVTVVFSQQAGFFRFAGLDHFVLAPVALFVYATGYFGFRQTTIFSAIPVVSFEPNAEDSATESNRDAKAPKQSHAKYRKSGLTSDQAEQTLAKLLDYMQVGQPYLDDRLTLPQVADILDVSVNRLSQVINGRLGQNFFEFVNSFRIEEVKRRLGDPAHHGQSLLTIALDCGFGSKSSFNRIFKNTTGQTPSQYKKRVLRD